MSIDGVNSNIIVYIFPTQIFFKLTFLFLFSDIVLPMDYCWLVCLIAEAGFSSVSSSPPSSPDVDDTWEALDKETSWARMG